MYSCYVLNKERSTIYFTFGLLCSGVCLLEHLPISVRESLAVGQVSASALLLAAIAHFDVALALAVPDAEHMQATTTISCFVIKRH